MSLNRFFLISSLVTTRRGLERAREARRDIVVRQTTTLMDICLDWKQGNVTPSYDARWMTWGWRMYLYLSAAMSTMLELLRNTAVHWTQPTALHNQP